MRPRIREFRKQHGMTQDELAEAVGCQRSSLSEWETGIRRVPTAHLWPLARCLRVTVDELYALDDPTANGHTDPPPPAHGAALPARSAASHPAGTLPPRRRRASRAQH